jgi:hypothetical protein
MVIGFLPSIRLPFTQPLGEPGTREANGGGEGLSCLAGGVMAGASKVGSMTRAAAGCRARATHRSAVMPGPDRAIYHTGIVLGLLIGSAPFAAPAHAAGPQSVLPPAAAVKGWHQIGAPKLYNSNNLFNLIDGEAQAVMDYAFAGEAHGDYAPAGQSRPVLTMDVFDMTDPLNAFGLFSSSDRMSGKAVAIGTEGVRIEPSGLNFWKGRYVVRTTIVQVNPATKAALEKYARAAATRIPGASALPATLQALPPGRQPRSEKYVRANVAGHAFLKNAVTARYPQLGQGAELFIAQYPNPAGAKAALESYRSYEKSGAGLTPIKGLGNTAFKVVDRYAKNVVVAEKGRSVIGVDHARDAAGAQNLVKQAVSRIK